MHKNTFFKKIGTERLKLLAVVLFFLASGVWYSHLYHAGGLEMGTPASAEDITAEREAIEITEEHTGRLNINTATAQELTSLSGIGEKKAADIVAYRETNGSFSDIADLMQVSGIGEKTFEKIKAEITVEE
nr:ComEA family DNA-binding protein [uncultured Anaerotignum sp.]